MNDTFNFNKFPHINTMQYNILDYLMMNNEDIWKVLYYPKSDCLSQPNLTQDQKKSLIYQGQTDSTPYRVFMDSYLDDQFTEQVSIIRVFPQSVIPRNRSVSDILIRIEAFSHVKLQYVKGMNRNVYLMQQILETLNGVNTIKGIGELVFDRMNSIYDKADLTINNNRNFVGYSIVLSTFTT